MSYSRLAIVSPVELEINHEINLKKGLSSVLTIRFSTSYASSRHSAPAIIKHKHLRPKR